MRIVTAELRKALQVVSVAVAKVEMPGMALSGVRLRSHSDGTLTLSTTDMDSWCTYRCTVDGAEPLEAIVSHRTLTSIAKACRAATATLELDGSRLRITGGGSSWTAPLIQSPVIAWPGMPAKVGGIDADVLTRLVRATSPAATRESLPKFLPVQLRTSGREIVASATDRYRVHLVKATLLDSSVERAVMFPPAADLAKIVETLSGTVTLYADPESGVFGIEDERSTTLLRMIDSATPSEAPPDMAGLVEAWSATKARTTVEASAVAEALEAVSPAVQVVQRTTLEVLLTVSAKAFSISAGSEDAAAHSLIDGHTHDGRGLTVAVNPTFLAEALKAIGTDGPIELGWMGPRKPVRLTAPGGDAQLFVMAVRSPADGWLDEADAYSEAPRMVGAPA